MRLARVPEGMAAGYLALRMSGPVFILGNHRSGTTWLNGLLAETGCFDVLTAFHVIDWERLDRGASRSDLLRRFEEAGIAERKVDRVPLRPELPEEYGYILNNAGTGSWLGRRNLDLFGRIVDRVGQGRPVLLKNPWDYANFRFISRHVPGARFVFIYRHPVRVVQSGLQVLRALWKEPDAYTLMLSRRYRRLWRRPWSRAFYRWFTSGALGLDLRAMSRGVALANRHWLQHRPALDPGLALDLRNEDLCADPAGRVAEVLDFLALPAGAVPRTPARPSAGALLPEIARHQAAICRQNEAYLAHHGYRA